MIGVYFSGTGNTKHCIERFMEVYNGSIPVSIESPDAIESIRKSNGIVFGYPIYFSNTPKIVKDFIAKNCDVFKNKNVYIVCTMGLFSGDGAGCGARLLKKCGAIVIGGLHLKMPDCIGDVKALKKPLAENQQIVTGAEQKIKQAAKLLMKGDATKEGLSIFHHIAGLFGQRLWFYGKTMHYTDKLKIDGKKCTGCGKCVALCSMSNLELTDQKALAGNKCTMCYRCINRCPNKAITLLGRAVIEQCFVEKYIAIKPNSSVLIGNDI